MHEDVDAADDMIANLARLLRRSMQESNRDEVPMREELEILEVYLTIERIRFADRLQTKIDVEPAALGALVPTLILQPLVENALSHGIAAKPGPGVVEIRARKTHGRLQITVSDDGAGLKEDSRAGAGIGLSNTRARLQHHYGDPHSFQLSESAQGGVVATIDIPFRTVPGTPVQ